MPTRTTSETHFEQWCRLRRIECKPIKKARVDGHKRPDFAIKVGEHWCIVEIKQTDPNPQDKNQLERAQGKEEGSGWWKPSPGSRLIRGIQKAESQLRKFSMRGIPTVVCFFDNTIGFYDEPNQVKQAMERVKTNIISAIAVLRKPATDWVIDLFHYPGAAVAILPECAAELVRKNIMPVSAE
jgi:hypothetical protein